MNTSIAHISDTHFGTEVPEVADAVRQTLINLKPDILILSGRYNPARPHKPVPGCRGFC